MKHEPVKDHEERKRILTLIERCEKEQTMSRHVDAEWLCNELGDINMDIYTDEVKEYIKSAPSIDICFCRECRYWHKNRKDGDDIPVYDACYDFTADDFCSYGEREGE